MATSEEHPEIRLTGISASPGICIGKAYLVDTEGVDVVNTYFILESDLDKEKKRFKAAVKKAKDELLAIIDNTPEEVRQQSKILETHVVLLEDKMLFSRTLESMTKELINAEWALKKVVAEIKSVFKNMDDPYFKERANDIVHVSDRIFRNLTGTPIVNIADIRKRVILVAQDLSPAETSQIQLERVKGFITDRGGKASHTSIIARSLEIPAVQGLENATSRIRNDDLLIIDGNAGVVIVNPTEQSLVDYAERQVQYEERRAAITRSSHLQAMTLDKHRLRVMGNIELPEEVFATITYGGDGIGLYRTEFQYMSRGGFPSEEELIEKYRDVIEVMGHRPVTIRTLDINGDKAINPHSDYVEENPALGLRAIRYCLKKPDVFITQLRAILRSAVHGNVRILLPLISSIEEVVETQVLLRNACEQLEKEGIDHDPNIKIGVMIEVPSAVIMADALAEMVDFFSIGTNDLLQYSLAIDRGNREVAHMHNPLHPALIRMVKRISDIANDAGIVTYMCGEMAADPIHVPILLGLGINELSMNPQSIPAVKAMIRQVSTDECEAFAKDVLKIKTASGVIGLVQETYGKLISEGIYGMDASP